jgi:Uncharacterized conserved protein
LPVARTKPATALDRERRHRHRSARSGVTTASGIQALCHPARTVTVCTLVLAWHAVDSAPVVVAANRDEATDRPAEPPGVYRTAPDASRRVTPRPAGRDRLQRGRAVRRDHESLVDREGGRSRGQLVADCLGLRSASNAVDHVRAATREDRYAGFNLVVADADRAALLEWDGTLAVTEFDPGVQVVVNVGANGSFFEPPARPEIGRQQADNAEALRADLAVDTDETAGEWRERAAAALGDHEYGVCVHGDGFGTRSASVIELGGEDGTAGSNADTVGRYWFADGPPCETDFERVESRV